MRKFFIATSLLFALIIGILLENRYNILGPEQVQNNENSIIESNKAEDPKWPAAFEIVNIKSPLDGSEQPAYFYKSKSKKPQPLVVSLHTWSNDYTQYDSINYFSHLKDINYIHPNFRGVNNKKETCCSDLVISDIDAAIDYALQNSNANPEEVYVVGFSGGGYATLATFMKSKHNIKKFASWCPLVDLVKWYDEARIIKIKHADEILLCTDSKNGILNKEIAIKKSPIFWETPVEKANHTQLEIYTGLYDGMRDNGVIPITHSINFYNKLLLDLKVQDSSLYVSNSEKLKLLEFREPLSEYGTIANRKVALKKSYGNISLTLFEGGHEILKHYAFKSLFENEL